MGRGMDRGRMGVGSLTTISDEHWINIDIDSAAVLFLSMLLHNCRAQF